jgi:hypothetical protein
VLVDVRGLDALVAEPQRDRGDVDALGAQKHRVGVPQRVRGDLPSRSQVTLCSDLSASHTFRAGL